MRRFRGAVHADRTSRRSRPVLVVVVLALCGNVTALQQTVVLPLVPELPRLLGVPADRASWVVTATLLSGALATPVVSRLADMYGKRSMVMLCLVVMVAGSALGAVSGSLGLVIAARALQGVGLALIPVGIAMMQDELPRSRVPMGVALMSATLAIGGAAGPPLAGLVLQYADWRALFWVTGGAGVLVLVAVPLVLSESRVRTGGVFDFIGALLLSGATLGLLVALSKGADWGWTSSSTLIASIGALVVLLLWVPHQLSGRDPLVDLRSAVSPQVSLVHLDALLLGFGMFVNLLVTIQLLQLPATVGLGLGAFEAGLWMIPGALVFGLVAPLSAGIARRFGAETSLAAGALFMAVTYVARVVSGVSLWQVVAGSVLVGAGVALTYAAMPTVVLGAVPATQAAAANGFNTLLRSLGTAVCSALLAALVSGGAGAHQASSGDLRFMLWSAAAASGLAALFALVLVRRRAQVPAPQPGGAQERAGARPTTGAGRELRTASLPTRPEAQ
jgi:MFS family permease